jgi:SAM-dependent methyltransferase
MSLLVKQRRMLMTGELIFKAINEAKANLDDIYDQPDPRAYFSQLKEFNYAIPGAAKPIFQKLIDHLQHRSDDNIHILDLGCSYGVNAALLKHDLSMTDLYQHWEEEILTGNPLEDIVERDLHYFTNLEEVNNIDLTGLDQSVNAIKFAERVGLLDEGLAINLETELLPGSAKDDLATVDLVVSTGCVGYVTEKTFERLLPAISVGHSPWMANFVLRMFPFERIEETLDTQGYVTEKLDDHTFIQRQFASAEEQEQVLERLHEQGIDPTGKEAEGHLLAEFYLSRPRNEVAGHTIEQLVLA